MLIKLLRWSVMISRFWFSIKSSIIDTFMLEFKADHRLNNALSPITTIASCSTTFWVSVFIKGKLKRIYTKEYKTFLLGAKSPVTLELPHQWLWEIIDEFVYQFQSFALFRCSLHKKSADELDFIRQNPTLWNIHSVLNVLYSLVDKSNINQQLEVFSL